MSNSKLEVLEQSRNEILLAEIGALIHDIGKLSQEFISDISTNSPDRHYTVLKLHQYCPLDPIVADFNAATSVLNFLTSHAPDIETAMAISDSWEHLRQEKANKCQRLIKEEVDRRRKRILRGAFNLSREQIKEQIHRARLDVLAVVKSAIQNVRQRYSPLLDLKVWLQESSSDRYRQNIDKIVHPILEHYRRLELEEQVPDDFFPDGFNNMLSSTIIDIPICGKCKLADFVEMHHRYHSDIPPLLYHLIADKGGVDGLDSWLDKGQVNQKAAQDPNNTFIATAFGYERLIDTSGLRTVRHSFAEILSNILGNYRDAHREKPIRVRLWARLINDLRRESRKNLSAGLGETRRAANDVTLWDHSYSVASLYKSALAKILLDGWVDPANIRWRLLRVNFDVLGLYTHAVKIADLLAYRRAVDKACRAVKELVEVTYPLGNEVYRDTTGIYFTYPDLDLFPELEQEIRRAVEAVELELSPRITVGQAEGETAGKQLKRLLGEQRQKAHQELEHRFGPENLSNCWQEMWETLPPGRWEVCPICRLRPMQEGAEACEHCLERRKPRVRTWLDEARNGPAPTIWLDEIADRHGRVALIVGKFGLDDWLSGDLVQTMLVKAVENEPDQCQPKNPSPARIRRVWETCQQFWEDIETTVLPEHWAHVPDARDKRLLIIPDRAGNWQEGIPYDGTIGGRPISLFWLQDERKFITAVNLQLAAGPGVSDLNLIQRWNNAQVEITEPEAFTFTVRRLEIPRKMREYRPYQVLLTTPDRFLALVPAADAVNIALRIEAKYRQEFGKVQNRLPLFLGLVFFTRKMPLATVMDAGRRMLTRVQFEEESWEVNSFQDDTLFFANGPEWKIPTKMGDGSPDIWYPYFFVETAPGTRTYRFQLDKTKHALVDPKWDKRWLVRVDDLKSGDVVLVTPSRFTYLFLEHAAQRFRFDPAKDVVRLEELSRLQEIWETLCNTPDMTDTKLQSIWVLFQSKWEEWGLGDARSPETEETFRQLIKTTFRREHINAIKADEVLDGTFHRCLQLYLHILKERVKAAKEGQDESE